MSKRQQRQNSAVVRNLLALLFLLVGSWIIWLHLQKRALINRENTAIQQLESGKPAAAVIILLQLRQSLHRNKDLQRINKHLADCYQQLAESPENSTEVSLLYYRRLFRIDPTRVPESVRMRLHRRDTGEEN